MQLQAIYTKESYKHKHRGIIALNPLLQIHPVPLAPFQNIQTITISAVIPATVPSQSFQTPHFSAPAPACVGAAVLLELGGAELEDELEAAAEEDVVEAAAELVDVLVDVPAAEVVVRVVRVPVAVGEPVAVVMSVGTEVVPPFAAPAAEAAEADDAASEPMEEVALFPAAEAADAVEAAPAAAPEDAVDAADSALWTEDDNEFSGPTGTGTFVTTASEVAASSGLVAVLVEPGL